MLTDIIRQLAREHGVPIIIDEKADLVMGAFNIEILFPNSANRGDMLIVCDRGSNFLWLSGLGEEGQKIEARSPELKYIREIEQGEQNG